MLKPIEMDENVTLAAQLEEEGGGPVSNIIARTLDITDGCACLLEFLGMLWISIIIIIALLTS